MVADNTNGVRAATNGTSSSQPRTPTSPPTPSPPRALVHDEDEIVISGISGRFPESADMNEFMANLLQHVNMVTVNDRRFKPGLFGIPHAFGTLKEIDRFDADAFGMLPSHVKKTDPQLRMTLETTFEALCDAGVNPADERGSRTGVFLGLCTSESQTLWSQDLNRLDGLALIGCSASMFANRVSYAFDFKGPSCAYDTACSTSIFALEAAVSAMRMGKCEAAIVTASTLILTPAVNVQFTKLGMLANDGACKSFDKSGDGFARAEAVATIYLQRASVARRAYASIVHIKTNTDGYKDSGITFPSAAMQEELLRSVYREAAINKVDVTYVEAHGTGTAIGDPQEVAAISHIFRRSGDEQPPLLIGSVKSNMGHAEGASGLCSIAKIVVMLQSGVIPANLHFKQPSFGLNSLRSGALKVVDTNTPWRGGCVAVNSFGFGGVNTHFVLRPWKKRKRSSEAQAHSLAPKLVLFSGRSEEGVATALKKVTETGDPNFFLLVNEMNKGPNPVMTVRGFTIYDATEATAPIPTIPGKEAENSEAAAAAAALPQVLQTASSSGTPPPLWFVLNGIGSQWIGMGQSLLQELPIFAASIAASARTLKERFNFDLYGLLASDDSETYENPTACFVGIAAIQIGLVHVLQAVGVRPAGFLGHSAGEMACGYIDGCLTAEETIIMAYLRGTSLEGTGSEPGAMAVVSMTWPQVEKFCPPGSGVYPACHNGLDNVTVSGSRPALAAFVQEMKDKKKGVKEVNSCGVAFHSPYIAKASVKFLAALRERIAGPRARSSAWISTSVPEAEWGSELASLASPEYFVNNFLSPVLFYEALQHIPEGATVVEVGPSGLLRGLVKKACPTATVIPLQARDKDSNQAMVDFLTALGKLHLAGVPVDVNKISVGVGVPCSQFPVPLGTPFVSPLVARAWDHSTSWEVPTFGMNGELQQARFEIDVSSDAYAFLTGHVVQGRVLFPATGYLYLVWKQFAQTLQVDQDACSVVFENVRLLRATVLTTKAKVEFRIHISELSGAFEVKEGGAIVATGVVRAPDSNPAVVETRMDDAQFEAVSAANAARMRNLNLNSGGEGGSIGTLNGADIYKCFRFYGFEYSGLFRGIQQADSACRSFLVAWNNNWIAFLDTFLQTCIQPFDLSATIKLPTAITKLVLNPATFLDSAKERTAFFVYKNPALGVVKCAGVELHWPKLTTVNKHVREVEPTLCAAKFVPYFDKEVVDSASDTTMMDCMSIVMANVGSNRPGAGGEATALSLTVMELTTSASETERLHQSAALNEFIRQNFGIFDVSYTVFAQGAATATATGVPDDDSQRLQTRLAAAGITLRGFDTFQKESWLDRTYDVIILHNHAFLVLAAEYLKKGSFLLLEITPEGGKETSMPTQALTKESLLEKLGPKLRLIAVKHSASRSVFLIRKRTKSASASVPPVVIPISTRDLSWVQRLQAAFREQEDISNASAIDAEVRQPPLVYLVANGADATDCGLRGLINCIRKEPYSQQFRMILNLAQNAMNLNLDFAHPSPELEQVFDHDLVVNIFDEAGRWGFYSACTRANEGGWMHSNSTANEKHRTESAFVAMGAVGDLTSFRWIQGRDFKRLALSLSLPQAPEGASVAIDVHFAALNFKDIMLATGNLPAPDSSASTLFSIESPLGLEFSGVTPDGARVCGYVEGQALATQVLACRQQLWAIPPDWSFAEAATVPVAYATAYMALVIRGGLQEGEGVLIHSGAGGVGQAAIRIALSLGCTVFTTVGSADKREFIRTQFPAIPSSHIGNSRDCSFESLVLDRTAGRGVDVVLNSLSGDKLEASLRCLARHGRFLEIGKFDLVGNKALGMELFLRDASFHGVMLDSLHDASPKLLARLQAVVQEGIDSGVVTPLPARVFSMEQVEPAFRYMGTGKHVGKILIQIRKEGDDPDPSRVLLDAAPRVYFDSAKSYIVIGGLGGIGLEFVNWMVTRDARRLVVTTRSGVKTAYQNEYIAAWRRRGAEIHVLTLDASLREDAVRLIDYAKALGPLDGFFNLALHLELGFMKDQTQATFQAAMNPKVVLTRNIDELTRALDLTHFVTFSSVVAGVGMPGQCNYGMANSACEDICERRTRAGLRGKAIELGPISEVGFFHEMHQPKNGNAHQELTLTSYGGVGIQSIGSVLRCMDVLLTAPEPIVISKVDRDLSGGVGAGRSDGADGLSLPERISRILGTDISKLNPKTKLTELGLDSIMSMELKQVLEQDYAIALSATEIRTVTIEQLLEMGKNSASTQLGFGTAGGGGVGRLRRVGVGPRRAATADLFQFDFMRNAKKTKILYRQCVHRLNERVHAKPGSGSIFICNSVEGPHILRILGSLLKRPAYTMQFPQDAPLHDLGVLTEYYVKELRAAEPRGPYTIAGYSAGTFVAIELALRLQETNEIDKLVLIDLTPGRADAIFEENFGADREKIDETDVMIATLSQVLSIDRGHLEAVVGVLPDRESRIKKAVEVGSAFFDEKVEGKIFERLLGENPMQLINLFNRYKPSRKYEGKISLVKTTQNLISYDSTEFWGLEEFCTQTPIVHIVESTHSYLVAEPGVYHVAAAINND